MVPGFCVSRNETNRQTIALKQLPLGGVFGRCGLPGGSTNVAGLRQLGPTRTHLKGVSPIVSSSEMQVQIPRGQNRLAAAGTRHFIAHNPRKKEGIVCREADRHIRPGRGPLRSPDRTGFLRRSASRSSSYPRISPIGFLCAILKHRLGSFPRVSGKSWNRAREVQTGLIAVVPRRLMSTPVFCKTQHRTTPHCVLVILNPRVHPNPLCPMETTTSWLRSTWTQFAVDTSQAKLHPPPRGAGTRGPLSEIRIKNACLLFCSEAELARSIWKSRPSFRERRLFFFRHGHHFSQERSSWQPHGI